MLKPQYRGWREIDGPGETSISVRNCIRRGPRLVTHDRPRQISSLRAWLQLERTTHVAPGPASLDRSPWTRDCGQHLHPVQVRRTTASRPPSVCARAAFGNLGSERQGRGGAGRTVNWPIGTLPGTHLLALTGAQTQTTAEEMSSTAAPGPPRSQMGPVGVAKR